MKRYYTNIALIVVIIVGLLVILKSSAFSANQQNQPQRESYVQQAERLEQKISDFKDSFYDKTMQNVNLALQGANRATTLVSVFAITFTVFTIILGFWGIKELGSVRMVRLSAEKNLELTKHLSLGFAYNQASLIPEAIREFFEVVRIDGKNLVAHTQLGYLYMSLSKPELEKSKAHSKIAIEINPKNYIAHLNLGVVMSQKGDKQEDILLVYLNGEKVAIEEGADDITIGKIKLFAGHCYKNLKMKPEAKNKYGEARPYFEKYKDNKIQALAVISKRWLDELEQSYKIVSV